LSLNEQMKLLLPIVLLLAVCCMAFLPHEFHVSITEVEQNSENGRLEMTVKLFTDDLERALETEGVDSLFLGDDKESKSADKYISAYIEKRLNIRADSIPMYWQFIGKEVELDVTWCYLESDSIPPLKQLQITSNVFTDIFDDQQNIIKSRQAKSSALILSNSSISGTIDWK